MKSLQERKAQRREQRELLAHGGVIPLPDKSGADVKQEGANTSNKDQFEDMTINQLKDWVKANGAEVPNDVKLHADIKEYARNYSSYLEAQKEEGGTNTGGAWSQQ